MEINKYSLKFCKFGVAAMLWIAFILKIKILLGIVFVIFVLSALLKINRAPMILLYNYTAGLLIKSPKVIVNADAMRFVHTLASCFSGICLLLVYLNLFFAWSAVLIFAIMKTVSSFGFCPGEKIYSCVKGGCCSVRKSND